MPRNVQLGTIVTSAKRRADMENYSGIADAEWKALVSEVYEELYSIIVEAGYGYFDAEQTITTDGSTAYDVPATHMSTIGVDYVIDAAGHRSELVELMAQERNLYRGSSGSQAAGYRMVNGQIELWPTPPSGQTYKHIYVPQPTDYSGSADSTELDVVTTSGLAFVLWGVTVLAKTKEQSDTREAFQERERARTRVEEWAVKYALNNPRRRIVSEADPGFDHYDPAEWHRSGW